LFGYRT